MEDFEILDLMEDLSLVGLSQTPLDKRLEIYREIQLNYPRCHIGGSIGLFLNGIDLGRNFLDSDLDICIASARAARSKIPSVGEETQPASSTDIDFITFESEFLGSNGGSTRIKIEYKIDPSQNFSTIKYKGHDYRVTNSQIILDWKILFAIRGSKKHQEDLQKLGINWEIKMGILNKFTSVRSKRFRLWGDLDIFLNGFLKGRKN